MQNEVTLVSCSTCHLNWCNWQKTHQKWSKIAKMVHKKAYFCHLLKNEWQVEQETNVFVFYIKFLISGHPWHPWGRVSIFYGWGIIHPRIFHLYQFIPDYSSRPQFISNSSSRNYSSPDYSSMNSSSPDYSSQNSSSLEYSSQNSSSPDPSSPE